MADGDQQQVGVPGLPPHLPNANAAQHQRRSVMQRMNNWIAVMGTPAFTEMDLYEAEHRLQRGLELMHQLESAQMEVIGTAAPNEDPVAIFGNDFMEIEDRYFVASTRLKRRIGALKTAMEQLAANAQLPQRIVAQIAPQQGNIRNTWGNFDGSLLKWKEFKQRFTDAIDKNDSVTPVYKFSYLKESLSGKAADLLKGYEVNEDNYLAAWERLVKEYDRNYPLAREYLNQFFSLNAVTFPATAEEIRRLSNVTMETVRNLTTLGYSVPQMSIIFVHSLHGLLNSQLTYEWNMELNQHGDAPTIENMVAFLDKHAAAATS